ncbi:alkaline phosphatase [Paenimyroides aestuarii]|uniref:Alkaline phosphatase n=1 Tax=Paenimyroides aestuarii TaxID=2968490 RepID=A0ABY5NR61_9FLAO|nr:alkaline phosphatase [Paenimyroides aestuarii]UUV21061.1 alkaline phosphatase [Paenimyroides aestuarii]
MKRRSFFKLGSLVVGSTLINPIDTFAENSNTLLNSTNKKAKNIIFMVSDGMSSGTLNLANLYSNRILGRSTNWLQLYTENKVSRGIMDMASASSIVTDSAAASSSWGGGVRVKNGALNMNASGEENRPIWQKFKAKGKKAGCVTTVPITHATPAGFTVAMKSRNDQAAIAEEYLRLGYDVLMGGGQKYFDAAHRTDKKDMYAAFEQHNYVVAKSKNDLKQAHLSKKLLGIFDLDALPYEIDRKQSAELTNTIPTLAEMTEVAINQMKDHKEGFVLQVESGKVDWAAHANDVSALIHEQLQFDEAIAVAIKFAEQDQNTLVVITTDHGNANPGMIYGKYANDHFDSLANYKFTNEYLLNNIKNNQSESQIKEFVKSCINVELTDEETKNIASYYNGLKKGDDGLYNYKHLPFKALAEIQKKYNSVGWISMDHSADYVEVAMFGPGNHLHKPFMKNTDMHYLLLDAAEVENKF